MESISVNPQDIAMFRKLGIYFRAWQAVLVLGISVTISSFAAKGICEKRGLGCLGLLLQTVATLGQRRMIRKRDAILMRNGFLPVLKCHRSHL